MLKRSSSKQIVWYSTRQVRSEQVAMFSKTIGKRRQSIQFHNHCPSIIKTDDSCQHINDGQYYIRVVLTDTCQGKSSSP